MLVLSSRSGPLACLYSRSESTTIALFKPLRTRRQFSSSTGLGNTADPRLRKLGLVIENDYAVIRDNYRTPRNPIVLAHGLLGFDELRVAGSLLPGVQYWRGIREALSSNSVEVIITSVPASGSIEQRAEMLKENIQKKARGRRVNIIAHSMGGIDSRFMLSQLQPSGVDVLSLTTIATPHRGWSAFVIFAYNSLVQGSSFADYVLQEIGSKNLPWVYKAANRLGLEIGAFSQLTQSYMREQFNPKNLDRPNVRYFSYGATCSPHLLSVFRRSHHIIEEKEGPNDGLVSVDSSLWGDYRGTLTGVSHLDLINWTNRLRWLVWEIAGNKRNFNAVAFYLSICDMLAGENL